MKKIPKFIVFLFFLLAVQSLNISKANKQTAQSSLSLASPTLEISFPARQSLIQFFYVLKPDEEPALEVYLSYRTDGGIRTAHLETIEPEGRAAGIESVFALDVDSDRSRELFIIAKWPINHAGIGTKGNLYRVYVYRKSLRSADELKFQRLYDVENKLGSGLDGTREGVSVSFPYKDYASIRKALISD